MIRHTLCYLFLLTILGCSNNSNNKSTTPPPPVTETAPPQKGTPLPYPSLPNNIAEELFNRCDFVDYIFYDPSLPMSISLNEQGSIRSTFRHVSRETPTTNGSCKATGRVMYQAEGEYIIEADFYLQDDCTYYIFMVDQKPTYANAMSPDGIKFFSNNISQAKASVKQKMQGQ